MKGTLFFLGSLLRWPPKKPREFLLFHLYILGVYFLTYAFGRSGLIFTAGLLAPLFLAISRGLPLDCLSYESAIFREFASDN